MTPGKAAQGEAAVARLTAAWVTWTCRRAAAVLLLALVGMAAAGGYAVREISLDSDTAEMLSAELPFRRAARAFAAAFPQRQDNITLIVEAASAEAAAEAAEHLVEALRAQEALFPYVFHPQGDPFFRRNALLYLELDRLQGLSDRLALAQPLLAALAADPTLRGLAAQLRRALEAVAAERPETIAWEPQLAAVIAAMAETAEALAAAPRGPHPQALSWRRLFDEPAVEAEGRRHFIEVKPALDYGSLAPAAPALAGLREIAAVQGLVGESGVRLRVTGAAAMFEDELASLTDNMGLVGGLSLALVLALLVIGLGRVQLVLATLVTLIAGLAWTAAFAAAAIGELNLISVAFAVLFLGLSVDFGIHFGLRYLERLAAGDPRQAALGAAAGEVAEPLALTALAAALGFFAFLPTAYQGLSELGLIAGVGMFIALFANLTVMPALLALLPAPRPSAVVERPTGAARIRRLRRPILVVALTLGLGAVLLLPQARFDDDPFNLRDPESPSVATLLELLDDPRVEPYRALALGPAGEESELLAARLEALPEVREVRTLADYLPADQAAKLAVIDDMAIFLAPLARGAPAAEPPTDAAARRLALVDLQAALEGLPAESALIPAAGRLAAALATLAPDDEATATLEGLLLGNLAGLLGDLGAALDAAPLDDKDLPAALRQRYETAEGRWLLEILPRETLRDGEVRRRFVDAVVGVLPGASGTPVTITEAGRAVVRAFTQAAVLALAAVAVLLFLRLRRINDVLLVLLPLILAAVLSVAVTVVIDQPFNYANVIVLPLIFGLGVAAGIQVVLRARRDGAQAMLASSTPRAVLFSALTTIGSFAALSLSHHRGTASMGLLLALAVAITLPCMLLVLPALLGQRGGGVGPGTPRPKPAAKARTLLVIAALLLGFALLALALSTIELSEVAVQLARLGLAGMALVVAVFFLLFLFDTLAWRFTLPELDERRGALFELWKLRMAGEAYNAITPAATLGGEPVKAYFLKRRSGIGYRAGLASLILAKTVSLLALLPFAAFGLVLGLTAVGLPPDLAKLALAGLAALGTGVLGFYLVQRRRWASRLARVLSRRRWTAFLAAGLGHLEAIDDRLSGFYGRHGRRFAAALGVAFAAWVLGAAEIFVIMHFLESPLTLGEAWAVETLAQLTRAGAFFIPGALGASEAVFVVVLGALTGTPALGLSLALVRRGRELLWILAGLLLAWRLGLAPSDRETG